MASKIRGSHLKMNGSSLAHGLCRFRQRARLALWGLAIQPMDGCLERLGSRTSAPAPNEHPLGSIQHSIGANQGRSAGRYVLARRAQQQVCFPKWPDFVHLWSDAGQPLRRSISLNHSKGPSHNKGIFLGNKA